MANITLVFASTNILNSTAVGPNNTTAVTQVFGLGTGMSAVTAVATGVTYPQDITSKTEFYVDTSALTFPITLKGTGTTISIPVSVVAGECDNSVITQTLTLALSTTALSGPSAVPMTVTNPSTTFTTTYTAVNVPFSNQVCHREHTRKRWYGAF